MLLLYKTTLCLCVSVTLLSKNNYICNWIFGMALFLSEVKKSRIGLETDATFKG